MKKKNLVLGVCGSIAAYKSCDLVRRLRERGWEVRVVMTAEARQFVAPLTFEVLSGNRVYSDMFDREAWDIAHVALNDFATAVLVAPATAAIIGKAACGICDDLLSCVITAARQPVLFAPAMNTHMWRNPAVQENVRKLKKNGCAFIGPAVGKLACGAEGAGRFACIDDIIARLERED